MEHNTANNPGRNPQNKKRPALIAAGCAAGLVIIGLCVWFFWLKGYLEASGASPVYVSSVASITGAGVDTDPRYSGLVEPQKITKINKDDTRTVSEVLVAEGDPVSVGTPLFRYDTGEMDLSIRQAELELEGIANQITSFQDQKKTLEAEKKDASKDDQLSYTIEIQSVELQIKNQEYQRSVKQSELEKLRSARDNNEVLSEVEGVVQQINLTPQTDNMGQPLPYMSILSSGEFRIKGTITEMNIGSLYEGQAVTVHSRVDSGATWSGVVDTVEHEPAQDNNNNMYYYGGDQGEQSSKYNFYVVLNSLDGLMLGQHVYIEPDNGGSSARAGIWLPSAYVVSDGAGSYVWARDENEKLERRAIMLGEYDSAEDLYQISSGLEVSDYIAYPVEGLVEGGPTTTDASAQTLPGEDGMGGDTTGGDMDPNFGIDNTLPEGGEAIPDDGGMVPEGDAGTLDDGAAVPEGGDDTAGGDGTEGTEQ
ncbi:efflux RND transporter periplasmic adaptor subunit [Acutalibacter sp. 1XD8-33]|uniref:efflux RND transporter periplasmic adaptor subunit n=1 Tax=Acutalibacter sp. 1XD8-33 TaxID=2320081 RepID=UPI000EA3542C|nr:efflux RND transporter periplasmic adaptor subunit [Acutalibacter sp. 1XD8-33]RKJ39612.1 efflux RND transporter periplasmic adaptor subunit [Acutalibacter sp. 1XD8-33]